MKSKSRHTLMCFYIFLTVICLAGLMQGGTTVWSSSSVTYVPTLENRSANPTVGASYNSGTSLPLFNPNQFFLQTAFDRIAPQVLNDTADGKSTSIVIFLADQANVSAAYNMTDQDARGWFVYNTLTKHAEETQAGLQGLLKERGVKFQSYWAANMIIATADRSLVDLVATRADVARIDSNKPARWIEDPEIASFAVSPGSPNTVEWGVANVNAPAVWALGFTGQGIVIGDLDTGTRWTHNALKPKYRGWNGTTADHNYNWHDAVHSGGGSCGANTVAPCDDNGHGTHTAGTTVGDDGSGNQIGVAPGARWIGCRNMDQGNGTPATYTECFQFTIAPTDLSGNNPDPALRPHVLNNSWTCPASEGCTTRAELETIVNNTQAAGIFVEASAGNAGPGCSTVAEPPAIYSASFTTGAIDITNTLAAFSSRGPITFYTPNLLKPNISAPGVNVRSSYVTSDSTYATLSGTSMAGPHVVGVVALLWSARPSLARNIAATKSILQNAANPAVVVSPAQTCGGTSSTQIPNNSFGYGRVDALAAYNASAPTAAPAAIAGRLTDGNGVSLGGTTVQLGGASSRTTITDSSGNYHFDNLDTGQFYTVTPSLANYHFTPVNRSFSLVGNRTDGGFTGTADAAQTVNAIDTTEYFVRQHYLDFLGREPDQGGFEYWSAQINVCNGDADCIRSRRIAVSASFFASLEFQYAGSYIYSLYAGALGRTLTFEEFMSDRAKVVGGSDLDANRAAFTEAFIERSEFTAKYPQSMTRNQFVDAVLQTMTARSGVDMTALRDTFLSDYDAGGRTRVMADVGQIGIFRDAEYNKAFVLMEYFGYLQRNPDTDGYNFWLDVLNGREAGNYRGIVCAFLTSTEYQQRFSSVVTHSNSECADIRSVPPA